MEGVREQNGRGAESTLTSLYICSPDSPAASHRLYLYHTFEIVICFPLLCTSFVHQLFFSRGGRRRRARRRMSCRRLRRDGMCHGCGLRVQRIFFLEERGQGGFRRATQCDGFGLRVEGEAPGASEGSTTIEALGDRGLLGVERGYLFAR